MSQLTQKKIVSERCRDASWDYKESDTQISSHCLHTYPAVMIPQIARRLIEVYGSNAEVLLDPFMGSGTSLVEAKTHRQFRLAYGIDINPLARLISKAKTTKLNANILITVAREIIEKSQQDIDNNQQGIKKIQNINFKNIDFWFKPYVITYLTALKKNIDEIEDDTIRDFFKVAYSEVVRKVSNTRNSEFKLYRLSEKNLNLHNPNVMNEFKNRVTYNIHHIEWFNKEATSCEIKILSEDARYQTSIPERSVDIIVSSPPYGDSKTTVAYGQFSRLSLEFLEYNESVVRNIDRISLGGIKSDDISRELHSPTLEKEIFQIKRVDLNRTYDVISFYYDFSKCVNEMDRVMKPNGYICLVVGNRTVKGIKLSTDKIIVEMFLSLGNYLHEKTIVRAIPKKRMPKRNSPTNVKGCTLSTMNEEYIVILKKLF